MDNGLRGSTRPLRLALSTAACCALSISACGTDSRGPVESSSSDSRPATAPDADLGGLTAVAVQSTEVELPAPDFGAESMTTDEGTAAIMLIRSGNATVEVDSLELAISQLRNVASALDGYVANASVHESGRGRIGAATLELKIPSNRFDEALAGLEPIGRVESIDVRTEDIGEEFVDVSARLANARRLEDRYLALLQDRTAELEQVLAVERQLARVREEIERFEGRIRYLSGRVQTSTLSVHLHEAGPLFGTHSAAGLIGDSFRQAWRNFIHFVAGFISLLGFLIPLAVLLVGGWWLARSLLPVLRTRGAALAAAARSTDSDSHS